MVDGPDNLVLEHLRAIRTDVGLLREGVQELTLRIGALEQEVANLRRDIADVHVQLALDGSIA
jgi:hypothetical protein